MTMQDSGRLLSGQFLSGWSLLASSLLENNLHLGQSWNGTSGTLLYFSCLLAGKINVAILDPYTQLRMLNPLDNDAAMVSATGYSLRGQTEPKV